MRLSDAVRGRFDALLVEPLGSTSKLKRALKAAVSQADAGPERDNLAHALELVGSVERKTTPLYVRSIHAAAAFALAHPTPPEHAAEVLNVTAWRTKRFQMVRT